jgi:hypothetical protein
MAGALGIWAGSLQAYNLDGQLAVCGLSDSVTKVLRHPLLQAPGQRRKSPRAGSGLLKCRRSIPISTKTGGRRAQITGLAQRIFKTTKISVFFRYDLPWIACRV